MYVFNLIPVVKRRLRKSSLDIFIVITNTELKFMMFKISSEL